MTDAIAADALRKRYGTTEAVADISLRVVEGEIFALLGPNGAGKSTTVRILATLTPPDAGQARVAGFDVVRQARHVRAAIGYVAQTSQADDYLTGCENLVVQARAQRRSRREAARRAAELLDVIGLTDTGDRLVATYSGGMRRRLEIAMGIVHGPRVLFLDEPTTGLDPEARAGMWDELARLAQQQTLTILLTTHYLEEADRLAQRVAIVSRGRVIAEGRPDDLKRHLRGDAVTVATRAVAAREVLAAVSGVNAMRDVNVEDGVLRARVPHGPSALPAILAALERRGVEVDSATIARPTLDDVYLHVTGSAFEHDDLAA
jgi:ABC-2 type transport system ATP-binding protein